MKVIAILNIDPDKLLDLDPDSLIETAVESELGWVSESGIYVSEVIAPDAIEPNDAELGKSIRTKLKD